MTIGIEAAIGIAIGILLLGVALAMLSARNEKDNLRREAHAARVVVVRERDRADEAEHFLISLRRYDAIRITKYPGGKTYAMDYHLAGYLKDTGNGRTAWMDSPRACVINAEALSRPRGSRR